MQLVYFDHRGQGRSARGAKETYTLDNNVEDMEALRQHLGLDQIVVIGASYGGMVALTYASRYSTKRIAPDCDRHRPRLSFSGTS